MYTVSVDVSNNPCLFPIHQKRALVKPNVIAGKEHKYDLVIRRLPTIPSSDFSLTLRKNTVN